MHLSARVYVTVSLFSFRIGGNDCSGTVQRAADVFKCEDSRASSRWSLWMARDNDHKADVNEAENKINGAFSACNAALEGWQFGSQNHPYWFGTTGSHLGDCAKEINRKLGIRLQTDNRYFHFANLDDCKEGVVRLNDFIRDGLLSTNCTVLRQNSHCSNLWGDEKKNLGDGVPLADCTTKATADESCGSIIYHNAAGGNCRCLRENQACDFGTTVGTTVYDCGNSGADTGELPLSCTRLGDMHFPHACRARALSLSLARAFSLAHWSSAVFLLCFFCPLCVSRPSVPKMRSRIGSSTQRSLRPQPISWLSDGRSRHGDELVLLPSRDRRTE